MKCRYLFWLPFLVLVFDFGTLSITLALTEHYHHDDSRIPYISGTGGIFFEVVAIELHSPCSCTHLILQKSRIRGEL